MREHSYKNGNCALTICATKGVHLKTSVQFRAKIGLLLVCFSGFGELRPIESSGLSERLVGSNPIGSTISHESNQYCILILLLVENRLGSLPLGCIGTRMKEPATEGTLRSGIRLDAISSCLQIMNMFARLAAWLLHETMHQRWKSCGSD